MGGINVKNTMIERILQKVAPHHCFGCTKIGTLLCEDCKYDIIHEPYIGCVLCGYPNREGVCERHNAPFERAFIVSERLGPLKDAINGLKFQNIKASARILAELLHLTLPELPEGTVLHPIPSVHARSRQRGYDHTKLIAEHLSELRSLPVELYVERIGNSVQHKADRVQRNKQARSAYALKEGVSIPRNSPPIMLIDDVITTGATITHTARKLKSIGGTVWVAALAHQPLD